MIIVFTDKTNHYGGRPHPKAIKINFLKQDVRLTRSPEGVPGGSAVWLGEGINHRKVGDTLVRDFPDTAWAIEVNNLEELALLLIEYDEMLLRPFWKNKSMLELVVES